MTPDRLSSLRELAEWEEAKFLSFLGFCALFIEPTAKGTGYRVSLAKRQQAEALALSDAHYREFMERILLPAGETTDRRFYHRLAAMVRLVQKYLRLHPEQITPAMRIVIEPNKHFNSCLTLRAPIVPVIIPQRPSSLDEKLYTLATKNVDLCERMVSSISDEEIKQMSPKDRALFASRMQWVFESKKYLRTNPNAFRHIDVQTANIRELETDLLSYSTGR